jgi:hypothetical protein
MRKLMKIFLTAVVLLLARPAVWAFSPGGPIGNGGDKWQVPVIDYGIGGDIMAPKNIGEEYRRNLPLMYYSYDANFLGYFGQPGTTNVDLAFALMNGVMAGFNNNPLFLNTPTNGVFPTTNGLYNGQPVTLGTTNNLDSYSSDLSEFPLDSQQYNYTANTLGLVDLKSVVLGLLTENMGLADPVRYAWTLHDRYQPPSTTCPNFTEYIVVQRNLDYLYSPLTSPQYSAYVNDTLYTYRIFEFCNSPVNPQAGTIPTATDPSAGIYSPVASFFLNSGGFYTGLTRDDVAGLRYLLTSNNIKTEATSPNGSLVLQTNLQASQLLTTLPISLLLSQSVTNDPATLQANYPSLTYIAVKTNIVTQVTPTTVAYYTNLPAPYTNTGPNFTNWSPIQYGTAVPLNTLPLGPLLALAPYTDPVTLQALYPGLLISGINTNYLQVQIITNVAPYITNQSVLPVFTNFVSGGLTNGFYFTNQPGPTVINYDNSSYLTVTTLDLSVFSDATSTNAPATLQALYPGLQILRSQVFPTNLYYTNYVTYLTNLTGSPYGGAPVFKRVPVSTNSYFGNVYTYSFGNVFTNHFSTNRIFYTQNVWITNQIGAPYPSPFVAMTNSFLTTNQQISGDFFIIPTNWCGFDVLGVTKPNINPPYALGNTNTIIYNGYNPTTGQPTGTNNVVGGSAYGLTQNISDIYTNYLIALRPGVCEPVALLGTNYSTNIVNTYNYNFANIITNHYYTNTYVTVLTTNIGACPGGSPDLLCTNISINSFYTNLPSGDFYIIPPTWCGYQFIGLLTNLNFTTNFVAATNGSSGSVSNASASYTITTIFYNTNYTYSVRPGTCEPYLTFTTNSSTNIVTQYQYNFGNSIVTNSYYTNSPVTTITTNIAAWTNGLVGWYTNIISTNTTYNGISGDFYLVPAAWCSYTVLATQLVSVVTTTNTFLSTNALGINIGQQQYSQTTYNYYTNATLLIQPSFCQQVTPTPALRRGVQHVQFIRRDYDSLLGQYFTPITNYYTMTRITNSQPVTEYYERVVTAPDFLLSAEDQISGPDAGITDLYATRNINFDQSTIGTGLAGPGIIYPRTTFTINKGGSIIVNQGTAFLTQFTNILNGFIWASFDGSTNAPVIYPNGTSLVNLENQLVMQITVASGTNTFTATLPAGANNAAYTPVSFTAQGGQPPYLWSASGLPPGLTFDPVAQTLSGTPSGAVSGVPYDINVRLIDSVNRTINLDYSITIY